MRAYKTNLTMAANPGGVSVRLEDFLNDNLLKQYKKLKCAHSDCQSILKKPVQIKSCGHALCKECAEKLIMYAHFNERLAKCPYAGCNEKLSGKQSYAESMNLRSEVARLLSTCVTCQINLECGWKGPFRDFEDHCINGHPPLVVQELPRKNSTHEVTRMDQTTSTPMTVRVVSNNSSGLFDSGLGSCSSKYVGQPMEPKEFIQSRLRVMEPQLDSLCSMIHHEAVSVAESTHRAEHTSQMVPGRAKYQHQVPVKPKVSEHKASPYSNISMSKPPTHPHSMKPKRHTRTVSLPAIPLRHPALEKENTGVQHSHRVSRRRYSLHLPVLSDIKCPHKQTVSTTPLTVVHRAGQLTLQHRDDILSPKDLLIHEKELIIKRKNLEIRMKDSKIQRLLAEAKSNGKRASF